MAFLGEVDIELSPDGDLVLENGDFRLTRGFDWLCSEVYKILRTNNPEWPLHPRVGADTEDFIGEINNRETASRMESQIEAAVNADSIALPGMLKVKVAPLNRDSVMVIVYLVGTGDDRVVSKMIYDFRKGAVHSTGTRLPEKGVEPDLPAGYKEETNPYMRRNLR